MVYPMQTQLNGRQDFNPLVSENTPLTKAESTICVLVSVLPKKIKKEFSDYAMTAWQNISNLRIIVHLIYLEFYYI